MKQRLALSEFSRFAVIAAAGFVLAAPAMAQTQLPPPGQYAPADARQDRIEELQRQVTASTAENERLQYQLQQANREITRLRGMVGEMAAVNDSAVQALQTPDGTASGNGVAPPPSNAAPLTQPPRVTGQAGAPIGGTQTAGLNAAQTRATGTLGSISEGALPAPSMPIVDAADDYSRARDQLNNGQLAEAEIAFQQFLTRHEADAEPAMLAEARYWLAFTYLARNNYQDAAASFVNYLQNNGAAPQAPEAQVRLGMALAGMGQTRQACGAFSQLTRRYPNAPARVRTLATREAAAAQCGA